MLQSLVTYIENKKLFMKEKLFHLFLLAFVIVSVSKSLLYTSYYNHLSEEIFLSNEYRAHKLSEDALESLKDVQNNQRGAWVANYFSKYKIKNKDPRLKHFNAIWNDIKYFPIPENTRSDEYYVTYEDSWQYERSYGGKRGHEGCDLIASIDVPGIIPIISATDGVVTSRGWLEQGGYRIGITSPSGGYFYYAHLDSYTDFQVGDNVNAGDILGFMGNSGYGPEGTKGMFVTHLHFGIYIYPNNIETSVNPYWILRMIEEKKLFCSF